MAFLTEVRGGWVEEEEEEEEGREEEENVNVETMLYAAAKGTEPSFIK